MTESPDPQLQLKKRARRRLVGAVAFAGLAAVVLPMVMDEEPKRPAQDVQIRIPGQDQVPFRPKLADPGDTFPAWPTASAAGERDHEAPTGLLIRRSPSGEDGKACSHCGGPARRADERRRKEGLPRPAEKPPRKADKKKVQAD
jgi:DedD protein